LFLATRSSFVTANAREVRRVTRVTAELPNDGHGGVGFEAAANMNPVAAFLVKDLKKYPAVSRQ
jgi:hypothetical protein